MDIINLEGENVPQGSPNLGQSRSQGENVVQVSVEPTAKKVLVQFLKCSACPSEFADAQHRVAHINVSHPRVMQKEAWTPCQRCHMRFPRKDVLKDHTRRVHQGGKSKCLICQDVFWTDSMFRQHWKKCVMKWVKSERNVQENAALEEQLMNQIQHQEPISSPGREVETSAIVIKERFKNEETPEKTNSGLVDVKDVTRNDYLCAFCHFIFSTKAGYMEHTKLGNCVQPAAANSGKYKYTSPVPCYYCPAHCASRKALQAHVKEAHSVVKPEIKEEEVEEEKAIERPKPSKKHIYPCRPCNKKFEDLSALERHQQTEHFECDNCFKFFSYEKLESHKETDEEGKKSCTLACLICGENPPHVFDHGEAYVDHMNEKHRSIVGVNWFQCVFCLKLNKRYFNRYYPTKRSLQLHLANEHNQANQSPQKPILVQNKPQSTVISSSNAFTNNDIFVPIVSTSSPVTSTPVVATPSVAANVQGGDEGQQIIQQFQIQLPADQAHLVDQNTQQIQVIQADPNNPEQSQVITLYTWAGN